METTGLVYLGTYAFLRVVILNINKISKLWNTAISAFSELFGHRISRNFSEEIVNIIKCDAALRDRTEKHRYYLQQDLRRDADREKSAVPLRRCRLL